MWVLYWLFCSSMDIPIYLFQTRAQVKLNFQSSAGGEVTITKSMSLKSKGKKDEFKTLDSTSEVRDRDGKVCSFRKCDCKKRYNKNESCSFSWPHSPSLKLEQLSGRCADMDDLMIRQLGVSKPILNYVIFCHQEDSHWYETRHSPLTQISAMYSNYLLL